MGEAFDDALRRLLDYAKELEMRDYRAALAKWERELSEHMERKPEPPRA